MEKETLEEFIDSKKFLNDAPKNLIRMGAKWQRENSNINDLQLEIDFLEQDIRILKFNQEKMYSKEEVLEILYKHAEDMLAGKKVTLEKWFDKFKK